MKNSEHLQWIHDRMVHVYGEDPSVDFLIKLRETIEDISNTEKYREAISKHQSTNKKEWTPPFRVGKKQNRAVLDSNGIELSVFQVGAEKYAETFCKLLNKETYQQRLEDTMKEHVVSLETAREAFRLGFDEPTYYGYDWDNNELHEAMFMSAYKNDFTKGQNPIGRNIAAPSKHQYQNWLNKKNMVNSDYLQKCQQ